MSLNDVNFNLITVILLSFALFACGAEQGDDLDQFMANVVTDMNIEIKPLPEVLPYTPLQYNADESLRDPFKARKVIQSAGTLQPDTNRLKEELESFPLDSLHYVGSLSKKGLTYALVKTTEKAVRQVRVGNYLGQNFGLITAVHDNEIVIKEIIRDEVNDDWVERNVSIYLQE